LFRSTFILALFLSVAQISFCQDSTLYKSAYAGGYLVVPENQTWELDRVFVNGGAAYSIQVSNSNFKQTTFNQGDTLITPYYIAEMELLDKKDMVQYQFYFKLREDDR
tara:strand:- start:7668 stop:7991 length:324 start_codon:yes stop_codon:yes gene_type:complete